MATSKGAVLRRDGLPDRCGRACDRGRPVRVRARGGHGGHRVQHFGDPLPLAVLGEAGQRVAGEAVGLGDVMPGQGGVGDVVDHTGGEDVVAKFAIQLQRLPKTGDRVLDTTGVQEGIRKVEM